MSDSAERFLPRVLNDRAMGWQPNFRIATPNTALNTLALSGTALVHPMGGELLLSAIGQAVTAALGDTSARTLLSAMPLVTDSVSMGQFGYGLIYGAAQTATQMIQDEMRGYRDLVLRLSQFYSMVYDIDLLAAIAQAYISPESTEITPVIEALRQNHPNFYNALVAVRPLLRGLNELVAGIIEDVDAQTALASRALREIAGWIADLPLLIGNLLRPLIQDLVAARGNPVRQGEILGSLMASVIITVAALVDGIYPILKGGLAIARGLSHASMEILRSIAILIRPEELSMATRRTRRLTETLSSARLIIVGPMREAIDLYGDLAYRIERFGSLRDRTGLFNGMVREATGLALSDTGYIAMRLDAHHIIEGRFYNRFRAEFAQYFGWNSYNDMDCIALHTEWHIRSGDRLAANLNLLGAEGQVSLTRALQVFLDGREAQRPFTSLADLINAHADFYHQYAPSLWNSRLFAHFSQLRARLP